MKWNFLDAAVSFVNPDAGLRRYRARMGEAALDKISKRHYEGAARGRRTEGWLTPGSSANTASALALPALRNRSRDLVRNNPYACKAIASLANHTVGAGIVPTAISSTKGKNKRANDLWKSWADSTDCDVTGRSNFYGLQKLIMRGVAEGGEVIIRKIRSAEKNAAVPIQLQLLEADFLDHNRTLLRQSATQNFVIQGIEFDPLGRRVGYWLFPEHPGGYVTGKLMGVQSELVPASEVLHIYRLERIGQIHGIPFLSPALLRLRDFDELEDAELTRQKVAACFSAFVYDNDNNPADSVDKPFEIERLEPGIIETLPPGKKIEFAAPPSVQGAAEYARNVLRGIATGTGITYEQLTGDYSQVNYSSARMGYLEFQKNIGDLQWHVMVPQCCTEIYKWFIEAATIGGSNLLGVSPRWSTPRPEMIDVDKETRANNTMIRTGQKSLSQIIRENGDDPDEQLQEIADDFKKLDALGIILDCDPRQTTGQGMLQMQPGSTENKDDESEGKQ